MIPILTKIEDAVAEYISSMSLSGGYYYDWGTVNQPDVKKQQFPSAEIFIVSEDNEDFDDNAIGSKTYNQHAEMLIRVRVALENKTDIPSYEINKEMNQALEDLKRLFGVHYCMSDKCETMMYKGMVRVPDRSNDIFRPAYMDTRWSIVYSQDRERVDLISN